MRNCILEVTVIPDNSDREAEKKLDPNTGNLPEKSYADVHLSGQIFKVKELFHRFTYSLNEDGEQTIKINCHGKVTVKLSLYLDADELGASPRFGELFNQAVDQYDNLKAALYTVLNDFEANNESLPLLDECAQCDQDLHTLIAKMSTLSAEMADVIRKKDDGLLELCRYTPRAIPSLSPRSKPLEIEESL